MHVMGVRRRRRQGRLVVLVELVDHCARHCASPRRRDGPGRSGAGGNSSREEGVSRREDVLLLLRLLLRLLMMMMLVECRLVRRGVVDGVAGMAGEPGCSELLHRQARDAGARGSA